MEDRSQELIEFVMATERFRNPEPAHDERADGKDYQWTKHDPWTLVHVAAMSVISMAMRS